MKRREGETLIKKSQQITQNRVDCRVEERSGGLGKPSYGRKN
jgi:hypothetical protein